MVTQSKLTHTSRSDGSSDVFFGNVGLMQHISTVTHIIAGRRARLSASLLNKPAATASVQKIPS